MGFLKKISSIFGGQSAPSGDRDGYWITVQCNRCGEVIRSRVNLSNDLSIDYEDNTYSCRKVLIGEQRCYQQIEVTLIFDANRKLTGHDVRGGKWVEA